MSETPKKITHGLYDIGLDKALVKIYLNLCRDDEFAKEWARRAGVLPMVDYSPVVFLGRSIFMREADGHIRLVGKIRPHV